MYLRVLGWERRRKSILLHKTYLESVPLSPLSMWVLKRHIHGQLKGLEHTRFVMQSTRMVAVSAFGPLYSKRALSAPFLESCPILRWWFTHDSNWPSYRRDRCSWTGPAYDVPFGLSLARMSSSTSDVPSRPHKMTGQSGVAPAMHSLCNQ